MDLERVIDLFEAKHTSQLSDRHAAAIQQLCSEKLGTAIGGGDHYQGFFYRDLPALARVLEHCFIGIQNRKVSLTAVNKFLSMS
jgi:hypothetical protein